MLSLSSLAISLSIFLCFIVVGLRVRRSRVRSSLNFPPGPPPLPIIGNLHQLPIQKSFIQFTEWSRQYGGIFGLHLGPQKAIVLSSWRAVRDLLDQRGSIYSSRPDIPLVQYVVPGDLHVAFMKHDKTWRRGRKSIMDFLKVEEADKLLPIQDAESTQMVWEVLQEPEKYHSHVMRQFGGVILASVYGQRGVRSRTEQFFAIQDEWAALLDPGAMPPLDVFPFLEHIPDFMTPWPGWRKRAADLKSKQSSFYKEVFHEAKAKVEQGKGSETFVAQLLGDQEKQGYGDVELEYITGFLLEAGADTTAMAFLTFIIAMAAHPDLQKEAQAEVDDVFGEEVLPRNIDKMKLPYLQAVFWEILRWRPGFPLTIPHATSKDDTYQGYFIPADTTVIMNTWAIQHNPEDYDNPDVFDPTRFLKSEYGVSNPETRSPTDMSHKKTYVFGAGRRVCAGQSMAEHSLMLSMAKLVWAFDIAPTREGGLDTSIQTAFKDAVLTGPKEVGINFTVRGESRKSVIAREWGNADAFLRRFE